MPLQTVRDLKQSGMLHKRLIRSIRILSIIAVILLVVAGYQVFTYGLNLLVCLAIAVIAFILGLFVFSKMNKVQWDEEQEVIQNARMDKVGFAILALYIASEIGLRTLVNAEYHGAVGTIGYLLIGIGASLIGRSVGTLVAIKQLSQKEGIA